MKYKNFPNDVNPGEKILLDDGKLIFEIVETDKNTEVLARVLQGGQLKSKKGVNLPNTKISLPALTEKTSPTPFLPLDKKWTGLRFRS